MRERSIARVLKVVFIRDKKEDGDVIKLEILDITCRASIVSVLWSYLEEKELDPSNYTVEVDGVVLDI